jgi:hypothetical protein
VSPVAGRGLLAEEVATKVDPDGVGVSVTARGAVAGGGSTAGAGITWAILVDNGGATEVMIGDEQRWGVWERRM